MFQKFVTKTNLEIKEYSADVNKLANKAAEDLNTTMANKGAINLKEPSSKVTHSRGSKTKLPNKL